jgi:hypothetical protein
VKPSKQEQFVALLKGEVFDLINKYSAGCPVKEGVQRSFLDITKSEFIEWLKGNYSIDSLPFVNNKVGVEDGFYIIPEGSKKYRLYYQEYKVRFEECVLNNIDKVYDKFVDYLWKGWDLPED